MLRRYSLFVFLFILTACLINTRFSVAGNPNNNSPTNDNSSSSSTVSSASEDDKSSDKKDVPVKKEWLNRNLGSEIEIALDDVTTILSKRNRCTDLYGESKDVLMVLNFFANRIERRTLEDSGVGIRMFSNYSSIISSNTGFTYRMFENVIINNKGPFLKVHNSAKFPKISRVGSFFSGTRKARALMLLHELAHLIKDSSGNWLIPDDGADFKLSTQNTTFIERTCIKEIESLK